jgi:hypothetical protein
MPEKSSAEPGSMRNLSVTEVRTSAAFRFTSLKNAKQHIGTETIPVYQRSLYMAKKRRSLSPKVIVQRLNRKLAGDRKVVGKTLGKFKSEKCGNYYLLDQNAGTTNYFNIKEMENLARQLGVLDQDENLDA